VIIQLWIQSILIANDRRLKSFIPVQLVEVPLFEDERISAFIVDAGKVLGRVVDVKKSFCHIEESGCVEVEKYCSETVLFSLLSLIVGGEVWDVPLLVDVTALVESQLHETSGVHGQGVITAISFLLSNGIESLLVRNRGH